MKYKILSLFILGLMLGCSTPRTSMIVADSYNQNKDLTTLVLMPYGNIDIPGKWTKTKYNEQSRQHFFRDKDSTSIAVTKNPQEKYPFYNEEMGEEEFARKFFEWEKDFYEKQGVEIEEIDFQDNFVVWTAKGDAFETVFLYGAKNGYAFNFAVFSANWPVEKRIAFLKKLFEDN